MARHDGPTDPKKPRPALFATTFGTSIGHNVSARLRLHPKPPPSKLATSSRPRNI